jgi:ABC-type nitrate/sulfonate/bicarbonate transport system permease component
MRSRMRQSVTRDALIGWSLPLLVFVVVAALWELVVSLGPHNLLIPTFSATVQGLVRLTIVDRSVWPALIESNQAMVLGYGVSIAIAIPLGIALGSFRTLDRVMSPYWAIMLAIPVSPLIPVAIVALGLTLAARVLLVVLFTLVYVVLNTRAGVKNVDPSLREMAHSYGASGAQAWRYVLLPAAAPAIFAGLRIGLGRAISGMVLAELLLVAVGIGRLMLLFRGRFQPDLLFALVIVVILEALILLKAMGALERRLVPWAA